MRRLTLIAHPWRDTVVRPDGNVDFFFPVPIHVAEHHVEGAVVVLLPALEGRRHVLAAQVRQRLGARRLIGEPHDQQRENQPAHSSFCLLPSAFCLLPSIIAALVLPSTWLASPAAESRCTTGTR